MGRRLELSEKLRRILGTDHVYFQPPSNSTMKYPCFVYRREEPNVSHANNGVYQTTDKYFIQYITDDPDDTKQEDMLSSFKYCKPGHPYVADNLHHFIYILYY